MSDGASQQRRLLLRHDSGRQVELTASAACLCELASVVRSGARATVTADQSGLPAAPYSDLLSDVRVEPDSRAGAGIYVEDNAVVIRGSPAALDTLAASLEFAASASQAGEHLHIEHYDGHAYLRSDTVPLVVQQQPPR